MSKGTKDGNAIPSTENETQQNVTSENVQETQGIDQSVASVAQENVQPISDSNENQMSQNEASKSSGGLAKVFNEHKKQFIIAGAVLAALIVLVIAFNFVKSFTGGNNREYPLVYLTKDDEFKFISSKKKEGTLIDDKGNKVDDVKYSNASDKYILFLKDKDLYIFNTLKKKSSDKIASDVTYADFTEDDKYIIYLDDDDNLYAYNYKEKSKLESNVDKVEMITKDYVFFEKDDSLYMRSVKASQDDKKKIVTDYSSVAFNEKNTKILIRKKSDAKKDDDLLKYTTFYDYSVYTIKSDKTEKVLDGVSGVYYNDDFTEFYYYEKSAKSNFDLSKMVDDDKKEDDEKFVAYTYDDYRAGKLTFEQYYDNLDEKYDVESRNKIRERIEKNEYTGDGGYTLYYVKGSKKTEIANGVEKILGVDFTSKSIAYSKVSYDTNNKIKMSEIKYYSDLTSHISKNKKSTVEINVNMKNNYTLEEEIDNIYLINKDIYYVLDNELFYTKVNGKKLDSSKSLGEKVSIVDATGDYKDGILFVTDQKYKVGDLRFAKGTKVTKIDSDVLSSSVMATDSGKLYYLADYDDDDMVGELRVYSGKTKKLVDEINSFYYIKDNYIYVLKDYSSKNDSYDLYVYKGSKKLKLIDYSVVEMYTE